MLLCMRLAPIIALAAGAAPRGTVRGASGLSPDRRRGAGGTDRGHVGAGSRRASAAPPPRLRRSRAARGADLPVSARAEAAWSAAPDAPAFRSATLGHGAWRGAAGDQRDHAPRAERPVVPRQPFAQTILGDGPRRGARRRAPDSGEPARACSCGRAAAPSATRVMQERAASRGRAVIRRARDRRARDRGRRGRRRRAAAARVLRLLAGGRASCALAWAAVHRAITTAASVEHRRRHGS